MLVGPGKRSDEENAGFLHIQSRMGDRQLLGQTGWPPVFSMSSNPVSCGRLARKRWKLSTGMTPYAGEGRAPGSDAILGIRRHFFREGYSGGWHREEDASWLGATRPGRELAKGPFVREGRHPGGRFACLLEKSINAGYAHEMVMMHLGEWYVLGCWFLQLPRRLHCCTIVQTSPATGRCSCPMWLVLASATRS